MMTWNQGSEERTDGKQDEVTSKMVGDGGPSQNFCLSNFTRGGHSESSSPRERKACVKAQKADESEGKASEKQRE